MKFNLQKECFHYLRKERKTASSFRLMLGIYFRQKILRKFEVPYLEIFITTKCNLKCKSCSNIIPSLEDKCHYDISYIKESIEKLLDKIDCLYRLKIHGGEVFLHPQLCEIIQLLDGYSKIKSIRLTTNGTIVPSEKVLRCIAESKVVVQISDYNVKNTKVNDLIDKLKIFGVKYVYLKEQKWREMGGFDEREGNRFFECTVKRCTSFYEGKIYVCSRAAIMAKRKLTIDEGISISLDKRSFHKAVKEMYQGDYCEACKYCDGDTKFAKEIIAGEQMR